MERYDDGSQLVEVKEEKPAESRELTDDEYAELRAVRMCSRCGWRYRELFNLGTLCCSQHPGRFVAEKYTCCGRERDSEGCQRVDHTCTRYMLFPEGETTPLPKALQAVVPAESRIYSEEGVFVGCRRIQPFY